MQKSQMTFFGYLFIITCITVIGGLQAHTRKTRIYKVKATPQLKPYRYKAPLRAAKKYIQKAPYAGLGKTSTVNGRIKAKGVRGYFKPSSGYKFVNPYARTK